MKRQRARAESSGRKAGVVATLALHGGAAFALLAHQPVSPALVPPVPIMVHFISPPEPPGPRPVVQPEPQPPVRQAQPQPAPRRVTRPKPSVEPKREAPPPIVAAPVAPAAENVPVAAEPPRHEPSPAAATRAAAPPAVVPETAQPTFYADYLQNPAPRYPPLARRMGQEGKVVLRVLVTPGGAPERIELRTSSGSKMLDEAALAAVKRWRFVPARQGEQPIAAWVLVPITFTLQG